MTKAQTDRKAAAKAKLETAVADLMQSDNFKDFLRMRKLFHSYSWNNLMLIWSQMPTATRCAGYKTWQKLNRQVVGGETGLMIFAPCTFKKTTTADNGDEETKSGMWFRPVHVFDVSQTEGDALPEPTMPCDPEGDSHAHMIDDLKKVAGALDIRVEFEACDSAVHGYFNPTARTIRIDPSYGVNSQVATFVHELTHAIAGHGAGDGLDRPLRETITEAAAFLVADQFGLDTSGYSFAYVAGWCKDRKLFATALDAIGALSTEVFDTIAKSDNKMEALAA